MTNQEFRKEANKLFDKVEYINENSGFISAFLGLHHLKGIDKPFCSLTLRIDQYKTKTHSYTHQQVAKTQNTQFQRCIKY